MAQQVGTFGLQIQRLPVSLLGSFQIESRATPGFVVLPLAEQPSGLEISDGLWRIPGVPDEPQGADRGGHDEGSHDPSNGQGMPAGPDRAQSSTEPVGGSSLQEHEERVAHSRRGGGAGGGLLAGTSG